MKTLFPRMCLLFCTTLLLPFLTKADCVPSFTYTVSGLTVTFNNTSVNTNGTAAGLTYVWSFSGGLTSVTKNPVITFPSGGFKTVYLSISDSVTGCFSGYSDTFTLDSSIIPCSASFTKSITETTVTFTNTSVNSNGTATGLTYLWNFSGGTVSSLKNPVVTFPTGGFKSAYLSITDSASGCFSTYSDTFTLDSTIIACTASFTKVISGTTVTFTNTSTITNSSTTGATYLWSFSGGISSTLKNPVITFPTGGFKTAYLSITDSASRCFSGYSDTFTLVAPATTCAASFTKTISGTTVTFTNTSVNSIGTTTGLAYYWTFTGGISSSLRNPVITFPSGGPKSATLTVIDSTIVTGCSSSKTDTFTLSGSSNSCNASFTFPAIAPLTLKFSSTSTSTNGSAAGLTYEWNFSDGTSSTQQSIIKTFATAGVQWATLTISDSVQGCYASKTDSFMLIGTSCVASFSKSVSGMTVSLTNTSLNSDGLSAGLTYLWDFGDGTTSTAKNPTKTYATGGLKLIFLTINDSAKGCYSYAHDTIRLSPPAPLCEASFSLAVDTADPFNFFILNTSLVRPASTYFWDFGDGSTSTLATPTHTYASFGVYLICLTVSDTLCTSTFCDSVGMDSSGTLFKAGKFGFRVLDYTTMATTGLKSTGDKLMNLSIHPNPGSDIVSLDFSAKESSDVTLLVTDITGKVVLSNTIQSRTGENSEAINISGLNPSIYFLNVITPESQKVLKLIKN